LVCCDRSRAYISCCSVRLSGTWWTQDFVYFLNWILISN
jgi:hypothetical protein